jgi:hypothetical protein
VKSLKVDSVPEMPLVVVLPKVAVQLKTCRNHPFILSLNIQELFLNKNSSESFQPQIDFY